MPDHASNAVFLSYAHEDAPVARRIAETLRAAGIEVWFDQSELRGGDAWDAKIRAQIQECALFVPIVSATTQARREAYFRLEWKLADERTHLMAEGTPFLVPVVIDETRERGALVPKSFLAAQWTRAPGGEAGAGFVHRMRGLLTGDSAPPPLIPGAAAVGLPAPGKVRRRGAPFVWVAGFAAILAIGAAIVLRPRPAARVEVPATPAAAAAVPPIKSIAVMPFDNLSDGKESAYFADGVHEDILTSLQSIADLKVIGDRSVRQYRGTTKSTRQIGEELGVAYVLEGSVREANKAVKVVGKLIEARSGRQVWAKSYDRDLANVFAIQSELAQAIAAALQAVLSPTAKSLIERRPTENTVAYDLYLRARELIHRFDQNPAQIEKQIALLQSAVEIDPKFADAWAYLVRLHCFMYFENHDHTDTRWAKAQSAMERAAREAPESPAVIGAQGMFHLHPQRDATRATAYFERQSALQPGNAEPLIELANVKRRMLQHPDAIALYRRAAALDPGDSRIAYHLCDVFAEARRYIDAIAEQRRVVALVPTDYGESYFLARLSFTATGSTREMEKWFAAVPTPDWDSAVIIGLRKRRAWVLGDVDEAIQLDQLHPYFDATENMDPGLRRRDQAIRAALDRHVRGDLTGLKQRLEKFPDETRTRVALDPTNHDEWDALAKIELLLDNQEAAMRSIERAVDLMPEAFNPMASGRLRHNRAIIQAWVGNKDAALAELSRGLAKPLYLRVHQIRRDLWWKPLHGDPRFEALLNDPKNHAPLF